MKTLGGIVLIILLILSAIYKGGPASSASNIESVILTLGENQKLKGIFVPEGYVGDSRFPASRLSLSSNQQHISFYRPYETDRVQDNFVLYLSLIDHQDAVIKLSGHLNFNVAKGESIGRLKASFQDNELRNYNTSFMIYNDSNNVRGLLPANSLDRRRIILSGQAVEAPPAEKIQNPLALELALVWIPSPDPGYLVIFGLAALVLVALNRSKRLTRKVAH